jgi:hypothetical protein
MEKKDSPQRHREHRGSTEKRKKNLCEISVSPCLCGGSLVANETVIL